MLGQAAPGGAAYFCQHCRISVNGPAPWEQHIQSAKHLKKASLAVGAGGATPGTAANGASPAYSCRAASPMASSAGGQFFCDCCRIFCTGPESWNQHVQSAKHLKKAADAGSSTAPSGRAGCPDLLSAARAPSAVPLSPAGGFYCQACGIRCSGPENWQQHVESARHIKITAQTAAVQDTFNTSPCGDRVDGVVTDSAPPPVLPSVGNPFYCAVCGLSCSGPEPWKQHIESARHLKNSALATRAGGLEAGTSMEEVLSTSSNRAASPASSSGRAGCPDLLSGARAPSAVPLSPAGGFYCQACGIRCSGPENWQQHVESARHMKITAQTAAVQDTFNTSRCGDRVDGVVTDSAPPPVLPSVGNPFYCAVCGLSCSGPEPWKQHIESARHLKNSALATRAGGLEAGTSMEEVLSTSSNRAASPASSSLSASEPDVVRLAFWPSTGGLPVPPSGSADGATYFCSLCQLSCSGAAPYRQHLDSAKHLKRALEFKGVAPDGAGGTAAAGLPPLDVSTVAGAPAPSPGAVCAPAGGATYFCSVCQLTCSGPAPYRQHLDSAKHLKKVAVHNRYGAWSGCGSPGTSTPAGSSQRSSPDIFRPVSPPSGCERRGSGTLPSPASPGGPPLDTCDGSKSSCSAIAVETNCADQLPSKRQKLISTTPSLDLMSSPERSDACWSPGGSPSCGASGPPTESVSDQLSCSPSLYRAGSPSPAGSGRSSQQSASFLGTCVDGCITSSPCTSSKRGWSPPDFLSETSSSDTDLIVRNTAVTYPTEPSGSASGEATVANMYIEAKNDPVIASLTADLPDPALDLNHTLFSRRRMEMSDGRVVQECHAIRLGYSQFERIDREDGISLLTAIGVGSVLKHLSVEGLVAFLQDMPLIGAHEEFSLSRC